MNILQHGLVLGTLVFLFALCPSRSRGQGSDVDAHILSTGKASSDTSMASSAGRWSVFDQTIDAESVFHWSTSLEPEGTVWHVEQLLWGTWTEVAVVKRAGGSHNGSYLAPISLHSGQNSFRVRQASPGRASRFGPVLVHEEPSLLPVTASYSGRSAQCIFSARTYYRVVDDHGNLRASGSDVVVDLKDLPSGNYFLQFDGTRFLLCKRK